MDRPPSSGPFLTTAVLCERVLEEKDGALSIIRVIDRVVAQLVPEAPPPVFNCKVVITLRSGTAQGRSTVNVRRQKPSGQLDEPLTVQVLFEGQERGTNVVFDLNMAAEEEGLYWFEVLLDGELMTKIPLRVIYNPIPRT